MLKRKKAFPLLDHPLKKLDYELMSAALSSYEYSYRRASIL